MPVASSERALYCIEIEQVGEENVHQARQALRRLVYRAPERTLMTGFLGRSRQASTDRNCQCRWIITAMFLFSGCHQETSEACGDLAWPLFVGKWEAAVPAQRLPSAADEELSLFLYPAGEAIKNGQKGSWKLVTCEGPTILIDLPRRMQIDACELRMEGMFQANPPSVQLPEADRVEGLLSCTGKSFKVVRTETRGWVPTALAAAAAREREESIRFEKETGLKRWWLKFVHELTTD